MIPGPKSLALARRLKRVESRNVTYLGRSFPVFWESAQGSRVKDVDGHSYLDLTSAFGVSSLGHSAEPVYQALLKQSKKMWHGMGDVHPNAVKVELLEALERLAPKPLSVSILSSTGAEAVESALKTARLHTGKPGVIVFEGAYHGLSYGTLPMTDGAHYKALFKDQLPAIATRMPFPDSLRGPHVEAILDRLNRFLRKASHRTGAILLEPIQGRGGVRIASSSFMKGLKEIAKRFDLVLITDEVMSGLGRTGKRFAFEHSGIVPDLLCIGKALGNGFPVSVCMGSRAIMDAWPPSDGEAIHTSTFLGNPLGCAMALASLKELQEQNVIRRAHLLGQAWLTDLRDVLGTHPQVGEIRGRGLMIGIEIVKNKAQLLPDAARTAQVVTRALKRKLLLLSGGLSRNVLTLLPPLTISPHELMTATGILKEVFDGKD